MTRVPYTSVKSSFTSRFFGPGLRRVIGVTSVFSIERFPLAANLIGNDEVVGLTNGKATRWVGSVELAWLSQQIALARVTQRAVADAARLDPSSLSRSLEGRRKMRVTEFVAAVDYLERVAAPQDGIARAIWDRRVPIATLARSSGLPESRIGSIVGGSGDAPTAEEAFRLRQALGLARDEPGAPRPDAAPAEPTIPILAASAMESNGWYGALEEAAEHRACPAPLRGVAGAFGMVIGDDRWLAPRWTRGEVVFINPARPAVLGRWIMCIARDDRFFIGRTRLIEADGLIADLPGRSSTISVARDAIRTVGQVVGSWME